MRDEEIIRRIRQGEKQLMGQLAERYYEDVYRYCYYRTGDGQTACDCTQETFLRLLRFMDNYVEQKKFKAYLLRVALNVCRDYFRAVPPQVPLEQCGTEKAQAAVAAGKDEAARTEEAVAVQACLMRLPEAQRETLILRFYYGYKVREIARITGVGLPTAKSRLKQGMERLKKIFEKEGIYESG